MHTQRPLTYGTRTHIEVRVGKFHSAEVALHLRRCDLQWFNRGNGDGGSFMPQVLQLLQASVIPRMFSDEIEISHAKKTRSKIPPKLGPGGIPIEEEEQQQPNARQTRKKRGRLTKKQLAEIEKQQQEAEGRKHKDVFYAFGSEIQFAYRLEERKTKPSATLVRRSGASSKGSFMELIKLSKRIYLWCYPYDPSKPMEGDREGGFPRPELVSMSHLFRQQMARSKEKEIISIGD